MNTFACLICRHITFDQVPVSCPVCGASIENFENLPDILRKHADPAHPSEEEKIHVPVITAGSETVQMNGVTCRNVNVKIGKIPHAMDPEHFINFVDAYENRKFLTRVMFTSGKLCPEFTCLVSNETASLRIVAFCNLHGYWTNRISLPDDG